MTKVRSPISLEHAYRPFISRELDRRIASADAAMAAGKIDPGTAEANLKPWAAAEAWLAGYPFPGTSPRNGETRAADICSIELALEPLTRARDRLVAEIEGQGRDDLQGHWRDMAEAVRLIERQRDGMAAWDTAAKSMPAAVVVPFPQIKSSLLANMFDADGNPLPLNSKQAA